MKTIALIVSISGMVLCAIGVIVCFYVLIRNNWLCDKVCKLIYSDFEAYERLPTYDDMLYRKWYVWDFNKFIKP